MASTSSQIVPSFSSPSSFSLIHRRKYEVFLSFRGPDTRHGFTDHLCASLKKRGIIVFKDDEKLEQGEEMYPALKEAIEASQYVVVIISEKFAESKSCLFELTVIMECRRMRNLTVFPIFYHVDPSDVRNQTGSFGEAFTSLQNDPKVDKEEWENWKAILNEIANYAVDSPQVDEDPLKSCRCALKKVGDLCGWHVKDRDESKVVEEISLKIFGGLIRNLPDIPKPFVGIEFPTMDILKLLNAKGDDEDMDDVCIIGICGMSGIGKTTLAEVIYAKVSSQFEARSFIYCIGDTRNDGIVSLQRKLISNVLSQEAIGLLKDDFEVSRVFQSRLRNTKVFIVLDDVNSKEQVEALVGNRAWFGHGSKIILTSRDHRLPKLIDAKIYTIKELGTSDALKLFHSNAFGKAHPKKGFEKLSMNFVKHSKGLPLALKVFGSDLRDKPVSQWENYNDKIEAHPIKEISSIFEISFERLDYQQKELFLDIACFFNKFSEDSIIHVLKSFEFQVMDLEVLVEKSLLSISEEGQLLMHDLLVKMGQEHESKEDPNKRKRLWQYEDIIQVLEDSTGSDRIEAIVLNPTKSEALCFDAFSSMRYLRMLKICSSDEGFEGAWYGNHLEFKLTNNLRVLQWFKFPLSSLPSGFLPRNLVELKLPGSSIERLQFRSQRFHTLIELDLSGSKNLIETPNFREVPNLEKLNLSSCYNLSQIDPSIRFLKRLRSLELQFCGNIGRSSSVLNSYLSSLSSLEKLNLWGCHLPAEAFPGDLSGLCSLMYLALANNNFTRIPDGVWQLSRLEHLYLGCQVITNRGEFHLHENTWLHSSRLALTGLRCLKVLDLTGMNLSDETIPDDISCLSLLCHLNLSENNFTILPSSLYRLSKLHQLILCGLGNLKALPKLPMSLDYLAVERCSSLEISYIPPNTWNSTAISHSIHCTVEVGSIGYDGQPYKIIFLHPQYSSWTTKMDGVYSETKAMVACGLVPEVGVPKWFKERSTSFSGTFRSPPIDLNLDDDSEGLMGYAQFIVFQVHDSPNFPIFHCELEVAEYHESVSSVFCVPELPLVGLNRVWVLIDLKEQLKIFNKGGNLQASIVTSSWNVEVHECWTHPIRENNWPEFFDALNSTYGNRVDSESLEKLFCDWETLDIHGPIKEKLILLNENNIPHEEELDYTSQYWSDMIFGRLLCLERDSTFEINQPNWQIALLRLQHLKNSGLESLFVLDLVMETFIYMLLIWGCVYLFFRECNCLATIHLYLGVFGVFSNLLLEDVIIKEFQILFSLDEL